MIKNLHHNLEIFSSFVLGVACVMISLCAQVSSVILIKEMSHGGDKIKSF